jgi:hypothetical protein
VAGPRSHRSTPDGWLTASKHCVGRRWRPKLGPLSLIQWINDARMALFFMLVGLEIKLQFRIGALNSVRKAVLPCIAACGGMVTPMAMYLIVQKLMRWPAGQYLYDAYDAQLHHFRRYSALELRSKLTRAGFTVTRKSHLGFLLFPAFAAVKLLNKLRGQSRTIVHDQAASTSCSALVAIAMRLEAKLLDLFSLPYGIRVLMTAKRDA